MLLHDLTILTSTFEAGTGWAIRPEGACRGETCIPLRGRPADTVDVEAVSQSREDWLEQWRSTME